MFAFLGWLFDLVRDLAILAAAVGVAKWGWDRHVGGPRRQENAARAANEAERFRQDMRQWAGRIEQHLARAEARQQEQSEASREGQAQTADLAARKVLVHRILQQARDPYLAFTEIEAACALETGGAANARLSGDRLRRVLIELVADGVVSQLDHDRYFIASEFETDDVPEEGR
jgi:hypothetical protein